MEELDTLNASYSFEASDRLLANLTTSPSLKGSVASQSRSSAFEFKDEKLLNIVSANLYKNVPPAKPTASNQLPYIDEESKGLLRTPFQTTVHLRNKYSEVKKKYIHSEATKQRLEQDLSQLMAEPCKNCELLEAESTNTKQALEEAVQLSNLLLKEVHRLTS